MKDKTPTKPKTGHDTAKTNTTQALKSKQLVKDHTSTNKQNTNSPKIQKSRELTHTMSTIYQQILQTTTKVWFQKKNMSISKCIWFHLLFAPSHKSSGNESRGWLLASQNSDYIQQKIQLVMKWQIKLYMCTYSQVNKVHKIYRSLIIDGKWGNSPRFQEFVC